MNLDTAISIATHFLAHIPILVLNPLLNPESAPPLPVSLPNLSTTPSTPWSVMLSTSGSTGRPKWVGYQHRHIEAAAASSKAAMRPADGSAWLLNLPLHHAGGLGILLRSLIWGTAVHVTPHRDSESILKTVGAYSDIDTLSLVPTQLHDMLVAGRAGELRHLRNILIGAGSLSEADLELVNRTKLPVRQSYGMTETLGHFCLTERAGTAAISFRSCGSPLPGNELRVVDDDGHSKPDGEVGHIELRGGQVISDDAVSDPTRTVQDWFRTGDYGYLTDGELFFVARRTDLIKTGGESVIAVRVESAIKELPYILDATVIGLADDRWGQRVHACVALRSGTPMNLKILRTDLRNKLLPFELPRSFSLHDHIPRNSMGKLQRELLIVDTMEVL